MVKRVYAIRDIVAGALAGGLIALHNDDVALRFLGDVLSQENNISRHPNDHELLTLGTIDEDSCVIEAFVTPHVVTTVEKFIQVRNALEAANSENR